MKAISLFLISMSSTWPIQQCRDTQMPAPTTEFVGPVGTRSGITALDGNKFIPRTKHICLLAKAGQQARCGKSHHVLHLSQHPGFSSHKAMKKPITFGGSLQSWPALALRPLTFPQKRWPDRSQKPTARETRVDRLPCPSCQPWWTVHDPGALLVLPSFFPEVCRGWASALYAQVPMTARA